MTGATDDQVVVPLWVLMNELRGSMRRLSRSERVLYGSPAILLHAWTLAE